MTPGSVRQDPVRQSIHALTRCARCEVRSFSPCGAIDDPAGLAELDRAHAPLRHVPADSAVFDQGSPSDRSYTILRGWVALTHMSRDGKPSILGFVLPGDVLGFERHAPLHTYGAVALGDVTVCSISRSRHGRLEREHPGFEARHRAAQSKTLEDAYAMLASTLARSASERVSYLLLRLCCRSLGRRPVAGDQVYLPLKQTQIALATGLTAVHVSRVLRRLREDRVVELEGRSITLHDPAALARLAGAALESAAVWM